MKYYFRYKIFVIYSTLDSYIIYLKLEGSHEILIISIYRDGRKPAPVNRDRSVSPSPLMMQSKGHSVSKSQLSASSSGHRHLTPSPIPSATPTASNNSTPSATKGGIASSGGNNATPGSSSKKGQKRQTKSKTPKTPAIVPTSSSAAQKQESKGRNGSKPKAKKKSESSTKQASIIPTAPKIKTEPAIVAPQMSTSASQAGAMPSMPLIGIGMELTREISPIHSSNPTPEPIRPPSRKKQKISPLTRSSSSSSSDSSDSDSEGEEPISQAPPIQQAPTQFSSIPVTRVTSAQSHPISSSGGSNNSMPVFSQPMTQKGHIAQKSHPGQLGQAKIPPPPNQRLSSGSSSGSDSDSSSGSSSSDSSSDSSDEENDKEVVRKFLSDSDLLVCVCVCVCVLLPTIFICRLQ